MENFKLKTNKYPCRRRLLILIDEARVGYRSNMRIATEECNSSVISRELRLTVESTVPHPIIKVSENARLVYAHPHLNVDPLCDARIAPELTIEIS